MSYLQHHLNPLAFPCWLLLPTTARTDRMHGPRLCYASLRIQSEVAKKLRVEMGSGARDNHKRCRGSPSCEIDIENLFDAPTRLNKTLQLCLLTPTSTKIHCNLATTCAALARAYK